MKGRLSSPFIVRYEDIKLFSSMPKSELFRYIHTQHESDTLVHVYPLSCQYVQKAKSFGVSHVRWHVCEEFLNSDQAIEGLPPATDVPSLWRISSRPPHPSLK